MNDVFRSSDACLKWLRELTSTAILQIKPERICVISDTKESSMCYHRFFRKDLQYRVSEPLRLACDVWKHNAATSCVSHNHTAQSQEQCCDLREAVQPFSQSYAIPIPLFLRLQLILLFSVSSPCPVSPLPLFLSFAFREHKSLSQIDPKKRSAPLPGKEQSGHYSNQVMAR